MLLAIDESGEIGIGHDVLRMIVMSRVADEVADVVERGRAAGPHSSQPPSGVRDRIRVAFPRLVGDNRKASIASLRWAMGTMRTVIVFRRSPVGAPTAFGLSDVPRGLEKKAWLVSAAETIFTYRGNIDMVLATELVHSYRFALRHIWNEYFWRNPDRRDFESFKSFKTLKGPLFGALVAAPLGLVTRADEPIFGNSFRVVPAGCDAAASFPAIEVDVSGTGVFRRFTHLTHALLHTHLELTLVDCFDWQEMGYWDLTHYQARIVRFDTMPEYVGHIALVEVIYADIVFDQPAVDANHVNDNRAGSYGRLQRDCIE